MGKPGYLKMTCLMVIFTVLTCLLSSSQPHPSTRLCSFPTYPGVQQNRTYWDAYQSGNTGGYSSLSRKSCDSNLLKATYISLNHLRPLVTDPWDKLKDVDLLLCVHHVYDGINNDECARAADTSAWEGNRNNHKPLWNYQVCRNCYSNDTGRTYIVYTGLKCSLWDTKLHYFNNDSKKPGKFFM